MPPKSFPGDLYLRKAENYSEALAWKSNTVASIYAELATVDGNTGDKEGAQCSEAKIHSFTMGVMLIFKYFPHSALEGLNQDKAYDKMCKIISQALKLTRLVALEHSELFVINKVDIEDADGVTPFRQFNPKDERFKGRLAEEDEDETENTFKIHLVLQPGFLKVNRGPAQQKQESVWIPAKLDLVLVETHVEVL